MSAPYSKEQKYPGRIPDEPWCITNGDGDLIAIIETETLADAVLKVLRGELVPPRNDQCRCCGSLVDEPRELKICRCCHQPTCLMCCAGDGRESDDHRICIECAMGETD